MKRFFLITILLTIFAVCTSGNRTATAYTIDGDVGDWGIHLSAATYGSTNSTSHDGYLDTHLPSGGWNIDYATEDNADSAAGWTWVGPLWSYQNYFDAEAMYFDNDKDSAYIAIIQGLPKDGETGPGNPWFHPGDIFIDANYDGTYEYGIDISTFDSTNGTASLVNVSFSNPVYYKSGSLANPWEIAGFTNEQSIDFIYSGEQNTHYVLEAAIPLSYLGLSANHSDPINIGIHWTMECGNDYLNLNADINPTPEPATMLLLGSGLIGLGWFGRRRMKKGSKV